MAAFVCTVSKAEIVVDWYKDGVSLFPSNKYEFVEEPLSHSLIVHDLSAWDYGNYMVNLGRRRHCQQSTSLGSSCLVFLTLDCNI